MAVLNAVWSRLNLLVFWLLPFQQRTRKSYSSLAEFAVCSLPWREWGHTQGKRQCQEHKRASKNIGINRVFTLFFHGYLSSNSPITPFRRRGELITGYRSLTTKVNSYMRQLQYPVSTLQ